MCKGDDKVKALIVTVAGMSSRFSESLGRECLKCIYYPNDIKNQFFTDCFISLSGLISII